MTRRKNIPLYTTGFTSYEDTPGPATGHIHESIEISTFETGTVEMLYGGQRVSIPANHLIVHWGMLPHQAICCPPGIKVVGLHIPLSWILQLNLPAELITRILNLELLIDKPRKLPCSDICLLQNWHHIHCRHKTKSESLILSEVRGRLLRIMLESRNRQSTQCVRNEMTSPAFYRAIQFIGQNFQDQLQIRDIAEHSGISTRHLTRIFNEHTGKTINEYLTRLRLSHAQRLLVTTSRTVTDIMFDSGFSCTTRFYEEFRKLTGLTPKQFRQKSI